MPKLAIAFYGPKAAGKTTAAHFVSQLIDGEIINTGDYLRKIVIQQYGILTPDNLHAVSDELRSGKISIMDRILNEYEQSSHLNENLIIDSIREDADIEALESHKYQVAIILLRSNFETRLGRVVSRERPDDPQFGFDLKNHDEWEAKLSFTPSFNIKLFTIDNSTLTGKEFEQALENIVLEIIGNAPNYKITK